MKRRMRSQPAKWVRDLIVLFAALSILSCLPVKAPIAFSKNPAAQRDPSQGDLRELLHQVDIAYARLQPRAPRQWKSHKVRELF